jgi:6-phosphogluconolactonase
MIRIFADYESLSAAAAEFIRSVGESAVRSRGRFDLVLSGGGTPRRAYEILAERTRDDRAFWRKTRVFWSDERCVAPDHPDSNYLMAKRTLLDRVRIPAANVHRLPAEKADREATAERYGSIFPEAPDLLLLGMGADGHVASLFPGSPALDEREKRFTVSRAPAEPKERITMTPPVIAGARKVLVLVSGAQKASVLPRVFAEEGDVSRTPARLVREADWFLDEDAARGLERKE